MTLNEQQLATIKAALLLWQSSRVDGDPAISLELGKVATSDGEHDPLNAEEIDSLLGELNLVEFATEEELDAAIEIHGDDGNVEIDGDAAVSRADDGFWVQAWVWVPRNE